MKGLLKISIASLAVLMLVLGVAALAPGTPPDAGLVTKLTGAATYSNPADQKQPAPVQAFMKVRRGDLLKLAPGATLQLLYTASGRQETWKGPATIRVGDSESAAVGKKPWPQPEVNNLPAKVAQKAGAAPVSLPSSSLRSSGVIQTMAPRSEVCGPAAQTPVPLCPEARREIQNARKTYQDLRKKMAADDLTPELYLLGVLTEHRQYPEMAKVVEAMLEKKPGDSKLKELLNWVRSQPAASPDTQK